MTRPEPISQPNDDTYIDIVLPVPTDPVSTDPESDTGWPVLVIMAFSWQKKHEALTHVFVNLHNRYLN